MGRARGADALLDTIFETTYGTVPAATGWSRLPFVSSNLGAEQNLIESDLLGQGRESLDPTQDVINNDGDLVVPVDVRAIGRWLRLFFGAPVTAADDDLYEHVFTSGASVLPSMSVQVGMPDVPSYEKNYGIRGNTLRIAMARSGLLNATLGLIGKGSTIATSSGSGTPTVIAVSRFAQATGEVKLDGSPVGSVVSADITYSNNLDKVETIQPNGEIEDADPAMATFSGSVVVRFKDHAMLDLATSGDPAAMTFGWGAAITGGMLVIAALSGSLWENEKAAKAAEAGSDGLGNAQSVLAGIFDMTSGKIKNQNELLILNARLMAIQLRADASKREASSAGTFNAGGSFNFLDRMYGAYIDPQGEGLKMRRAAGAQQALIRDLQSGKPSPDQAMQAAEKLDYSGLTVTRDQLMQAIIDSSQSGLLRKTAELIDQSLNDKSLAPSLRTTPPPKRERSGSEREKREKYEWDRPIVEPVNRSFFAEVAQMEREREEAAKNRAKYAQDIIDSHNDDIALMKIESGLIGANETTRRDILEMEALKLDLARAGVLIGQSEYDIALKTLEARQEYGRTIADQSRDWKETQRIGENFVDTVLNPDNWKDWGDLGKKILKDLYLDMLRLAAINPLKNMLFGSELPTMGGVFGSLGKIGGGAGSGYMEGDGGLLGFLKKPSSGFAAGTHYFGGGMAMVGENGPENVLLPRGSRIMTAADTRRMMGNGGGMSISMPITIDATGADAAGLARVEQKLDQLRAELPGTILMTVNDGKTRGYIR